MYNSGFIVFGIYLVFIVIIINIFLKNKKQKNNRIEMLNNLKTGDKIVTIGGFHGVVIEINDNLVTIELDKKGYMATIDKNAISKINTSK